MDAILSELLEKDIPKINSIIGNGLACTHLNYTEAYIDAVFTSASKGFPPGLTYIGCKRCTPHEEFALVTKKKGTRRQLDTAKSNIYLMKYFFAYNGHPIEPRYIYLPYVEDAGFSILHIFFMFFVVFNAFHV